MNSYASNSEDPLSETSKGKDDERSRGYERALQLASPITGSLTGGDGHPNINVDQALDLMREQTRLEKERELRLAEAQLREKWNVDLGRRMAWQEKLEADAREDERVRCLMQEKDWERRQAATAEGEQRRFDEIMRLVSMKEEAVKRREDSLRERDDRITRREVEVEGREDRLREEEDKQLRRECEGTSDQPDHLDQPDQESGGGKPRPRMDQVVALLRERYRLEREKELRVAEAQVRERWSADMAKRVEWQERQEAEWREEKLRCMRHEREMERKEAASEEREQKMLNELMRLAAIKEETARRRDEDLREGEAKLRRREEDVLEKEKRAKEREESLEDREEAARGREEGLRLKEEAARRKEGELREGEEGARRRDEALRDNELKAQRREWDLRERDESARKREEALKDREEAFRRMEDALRDREEIFRRREDAMRDREETYRRMEEDMLARERMSGEEAERLCRGWRELEGSRERLKADEAEWRARDARREAREEERERDAQQREQWLRGDLEAERERARREMEECERKHSEEVERLRRLIPKRFVRACCAGRSQEGSSLKSLILDVTPN